MTTISRDELKDRIIGAMYGAMPGEMDLVRDSDFAHAADAILDIMFDVILTKKFDEMIDLLGVGHANVMIGEEGHRVWVCTEGGTILRVKASKVTLDDRRINKDADNE